MTAAEALKLIRQYAQAGMIVLTQHARERMAERNVLEKSIRRALVNAASCVWQPEKGTWKTKGKGLDGEGLTVAVALRNRLIVVTVYE